METKLREEAIEATETVRPALLRMPETEGTRLLMLLEAQEINLWEIEQEDWEVAEELPSAA